MTLPFYIMVRFGMAFLRVLAVIVFLIILFQYIENIRKFMEASGSLRELFLLTLLQVPSSLSRIFPLVMLLASLTLFVGMSRSSELVVTRAAGVSAIRFVFVPVVMALALGIFATAVLNPITAVTIKKYDEMSDRITRSDRAFLSLGQDGVWLRQGVEEQQAVVHAARSSPDGSALVKVQFHVFDASGRLSERIVADEALLIPGAWRLVNVRRWKVDATADDFEIERLDTDQLATDLTPEQILNSFAAPEAISFWELQSFIDRMETAGFSAVRHRQFYQSALATPALFVAMVLVGAGFTMRHARFGKIGIMVLITVLAGFTLYSFNNVTAALGAAGSLSIWLAAWAPSIVAIFLALALLLHLEDG